MGVKGGVLGSALGYEKKRSTLTNSILVNMKEMVVFQASTPSYACI